MNKQIHNIEPVYNKESKILILGSFPSVKSREGEFFYHHPQNRFWRLLSLILNNPQPNSIDSKKKFLLNNHIALWDVISSCDIEGSSDSSIKNVVPNDISIILKNADIKAIFSNGATSYKYYKQYIEKTVGREAIKLPSTSPANASYTIDRLKTEWSLILEYIK